jgi:hypothetical protein
MDKLSASAAPPEQSREIIRALLEDWSDPHEQNP